MTKELEKKVKQAIKLIQSAGKIAKEHGQPLEIAYSGGKDSDVILELAKMSGVEYRAIYKNTTIDPPGTIKHALDMGAEMIRPKYNFLQLIEQHGFPTRFRRHCCKYLKEYKVLDYAVIGVRRDESRKRMERYHEPEQCRVYSKDEKCRQYMPILEWSLQDVEEFLKDRNIKCAPVYYDENGEFKAERRLGCMCCPLKSRKLRIADIKSHPNIIKLWIRGGQKYLQKHPNTKNANRFTNVYSWLVMDIFCDSYDEFMERFGPTLFDDGIDCKEYLENYFNVKL